MAYSDLLYDIDFEKRHRFFEDIVTGPHLNLMVVDGGSSSTNLEVQNSLFKDGQLHSSVSSVGNYWPPGTIGGSHIANREVLKVLREELSPLIARGLVTPDDLTAFV
ncbi:hypothetical protein INS49_005054 [Diaporthe citri]|uniref:uncharacterized protein n=1 Tax=Diaporthe citri TaxID=83186 RepID=UPI001C7EFCE4|nr:uncharacterized protein INS49_005054 [Diaporthe citri]KAG6354083.1 hypothetical protein INS49_005054 [Diaporthe citri]